MVIFFTILLIAIPVLLSLIFMTNAIALIFGGCADFLECFCGRFYHDTFDAPLPVSQKLSRHLP